MSFPSALFFMLCTNNCLSNHMQVMLTQLSIEIIIFTRASHRYSLFVKQHHHVFVDFFHLLLQFFWCLITVLLILLSFVIKACSKK